MEDSKDEGVSYVDINSRWLGQISRVFPSSGANKINKVSIEVQLFISFFSSKEMCRENGRYFQSAVARDTV